MELRVVDLVYHVALFLIVLAAITTLYIRFFYVDFAHIKGLPEIPGGSFISGHLYMLGNDHASTAEKWAVTNSWPVYQVRLGNRRAIILNSFDVAREWIVSKQTSTIDRPWLYTFHGVVSKTSGTYIPASHLLLGVLRSFLHP
jgi:phenylacetate 2-hydroxylase